MLAMVSCGLAVNKTDKKGVSYELAMVYLGFTSLNTA